jgi:hypothetical protein
MAHDERTFVLPVTVVSPTDVARLQREVEQLAEFLGQAKIRKSEEAKLPTPTEFLSDVCDANGLNLLHEADREYLIKAFEAMKGQAPLLHFSFAANPSTTFLGRLLKWLRQEIHPYALVTVGLQPGIGAGCMMRTANKYFDFSLRSHLQAQRQLLTGQIVGHADTEPAQNG